MTQVVVDQVPPVPEPVIVNLPQPPWETLPPPVFHRRLTLVAHRKELGRLPLEVAQTIRRTLKEDCLPRLLELMPWIGGDMRFGTKQD